MTQETWRVDQLRQQLGHAIGNTKATQPYAVYKTVEEGAPICKPHYDPETGAVYYDVGIMWTVRHGQRGKTWKMIVALDRDNDTYTVFLVRLMPTNAILKGDKRMSELLAESDDIYNEDLEEAVVRMWKQAIEDHCEGMVAW